MEDRRTQVPQLPAEIIEQIATKLMDVDDDGRIHVHVRARANLSLANRRFRQIVLPICYQCVPYEAVRPWLEQRTNGDDIESLVSA